MVFHDQEPAAPFPGTWGGEGAFSTCSAYGPELPPMAVAYGVPVEGPVMVQECLYCGNELDELGACPGCGGRTRDVYLRRPEVRA